MLEKVINMLEILKEILQSAVIVPNLGIGVITMIEHNTLHCEWEICLHHAN